MDITAYLHILAGFVLTITTTRESLRALFAKPSLFEAYITLKVVILDLLTSAATPTERFRTTGPEKSIGTLSGSLWFSAAIIRSRDVISNLRPTAASWQPRQFALSERVPSAANPRPSELPFPNPTRMIMPSKRFMGTLTLVPVIANDFAGTNLSHSIMLWSVRRNLLQARGCAAAPVVTAVGSAKAAASGYLPWRAHDQEEHI